MGNKERVSLIGIFWPEGLPKTYDELYQMYGRQITSFVRRLNKIPDNLDDLSQSIFMKLMETDVLQKFTNKVIDTYVVSALEACEILGVSWSQWRNMVGKRIKGRKDFPVPLRGPIDRATRQVKPYSKEAVYSLRSIFDLDDSGYFKVRHNPRIPPSVPAKGFYQYLNRAIHNYFANECRTKSRRHKERPQNPTPTGDYWETSLVDYSGCGVDDAVDIVNALSQLDDGDLISIKDRDSVGEGAYSLAMARMEKKIRSVSQMMQHGYSLDEAVQQTLNKSRQTSWSNNLVVSAA